MKAIVVGDMVVARTSGTSGYNIPEDLIDVPDERLRFDAEKIVDIGEDKVFFIDPDGQKHIADAPDRQMVTCSWDGDLAKADDGWREETIADKLLFYLAGRRWQAQNAGVVWEGHKAGTDDASRAAVAQAIMAIDNGAMSPPIIWKFKTDFAELTRDQLVSLAGAMAAHVQSCFNLQAQLEADIESALITTPEQIDAAGWPPAAA